MQVYSVDMHVHYEGTTVMGIFSTREKADRAAEAENAELEQWETDKWFSVHEWTVDPD